MAEQRDAFMFNNKISKTDDRLRIMNVMTD